MSFLPVVARAPAAAEWGMAESQSPTVNYNEMFD